VLRSENNVIVVIESPTIREIVIHSSNVPPIVDTVDDFDPETFKTSFG